MSLDSLLIRGLCISVLLIALALTQVDLRDRLGEPTTGTGVLPQCILGFPSGV